MSLTINREQLEKLEGLIGYGRPDAEIIYFGLEEAGGGSKNLEQRLRIDDYEFLDCKRFHLDFLAQGDSSYRLHSDDKDAKVKFQPVWMYMSYIMLKMKGLSKDEMSANDSFELRKYQNNLLGTKSADGKTLLADIYPIPCASLNSWGSKNESYNDVIPFYKDKKDYKEKVLSKRVDLFKKLLNSETSRTKSIICYGRSHWKEFAKFFDEFEASFSPLTLSKPCKFSRLNDGTSVYLVPFFGNGQMSYEFLDELVDHIKSESNP